MLGAAMEATTGTGDWKETEVKPWQDMKALSNEQDRLEQMSKEELKAEVLKMQGSSVSREQLGFRRQPKA